MVLPIVAKTATLAAMAQQQRGSLVALGIIGLMVASAVLLLLIAGDARRPLPSGGDWRDDLRGYAMSDDLPADQRADMQALVQDAVDR